MMKRKGSSRWNALLGTCILIGAASLVTRSARAQTYYIDEMTDWTGNGCEAEDLNTVTKDFRAILDAKGWKGSRYLNADAWPQDMIETCNGSKYGANGMDSSYGDAADLLVVAGHGNTGLLAFANQRESKCSVDLGSSSNLKTQGVARLGEMAGAKASIGMWLTCCTLKKESLAAHANYQWMKQQIGFIGESAFSTDMVAAFGRNSGAPSRTGTISNAYAWLVAMEDEPGWFTGDNSPIVVSYGNTSAEADSNHAYLDMSLLQSPRTGGPACGSGPPRFYYEYTVQDHGSAGCN